MPIKRSHMLVALSLGGTLAAMSATQAAAFDPVPASGPMGAPGAAMAAPADVIFAMRPLDEERYVVGTVDGSAAVDGLTEVALDLGASESAVPRDGYIYLQAGDVVVPVYIGDSRRIYGGGAVRREAVDAMLDLDASRSGR